MLGFSFSSSIDVHVGLIFASKLAIGVDVRQSENVNVWFVVEML